MMDQPLDLRAEEEEAMEGTMVEDVCRQIPEEPLTVPAPEPSLAVAMVVDTKGDRSLAGFPRALPRLGTMTLPRLRAKADRSLAAPPRGRLRAGGQ